MVGVMHLATTGGFALCTWVRNRFKHRAHDAEYSFLTTFLIRIFDVIQQLHVNLYHHYQSRQMKGGEEGKDS
jgi:hypothetical protein